MKILFSSHHYAPSVGGIVTVSELLVSEFVRLGHDVVVVTQTPGSSNVLDPCVVERRPSVATLFRLTRWCDVLFHNQISLRTVWPLLLFRRPWVVAHHMWIPRSLNGSLKQLLLRRSTGISVSRAIAEHIVAATVVIPNPYDDELFRPPLEAQRDLDLVFVGRLIRDKGMHLLLDALAALKALDQRPSLTVIGYGQEEAALQLQVRSLGLEDQVRFTGSKTGKELADLLHRHKILVVPSIWNEPFGIVALEGMACGCVVLGSDRGGLVDAIGDAGLTFPGEDVVALRDQIARLLSDDVLRARLQRLAPGHLGRHKKEIVAAEYLQVLEAACGRNANAR
jgi:glycogen(starch) synthase